MEKTWLIRTKNNHILGPVTKDKVRELIEKGSIKGEDEVCAGNGYWFYVREKDLINKYIKGDIPQGFNPVSEADTVLCAPGVTDVTNPAVQNFNNTQVESNTTLPTDDDLAYPEMEANVPSDDDLDYPDMQVSNTSNTASTTVLNVSELKEKLSEVSEDEIEPIVEESSKVSGRLEEIIEDDEEEDGHVNKYAKKKVKLTQKRIKKKSSAPKLKQRNDNLLIYIAFAILIVAIGIFMYRKNLMKKFLSDHSLDLFINKAHAQVTTPVVNIPKKKP